MSERGQRVIPLKLPCTVKTCPVNSLCDQALYTIRGISVDFADEAQFNAIVEELRERFGDLIGP